MMVQDKVTGEYYDAEQAIQDLIWNNPDYIDMLVRMQNEEGRGWPKKEE